MSLEKSIEGFRLRRKLKREKPHIWRIPSARAAYIQNYKVGTRSLRWAIGRYMMKQDQGVDISYEEISKEMLNPFDKKHSGFYTLKSFKKKWPDLYLFAFVRNPLSRLYSSYANKVLDAKKLGIKNQFKEFGVTFDTTFDEFVRIVADLPDHLSDRHFRSQSWFVSLDGVLVLDYMGKLESFNEDWEVLREKFDFPELPHKNTSSLGKVSFRDHYTKETYSLALERYRDDIELLGYSDDV